jgi:hypothetical protein
LACRIVSESRLDRAATRGSASWNAPLVSTAGNDCAPWSVRAVVGQMRAITA